MKLSRNMKSCVSITAQRTTIGLKPKRKYKNISILEKISNISWSTMPYHKLKISVTDICSQDKTKSSFTQSEWKRTTFVTLERFKISKSSSVVSLMKANGSSIIISSSVSSIKTQENWTRTCSSSKAFASCSILTTACWLTLELSQKETPSSKCTSIWNWIQNAEECVAIWDWR